MEMSDTIDGLGHFTLGKELRYQRGRVPRIEYSDQSVTSYTDSAVPVRVL